MNLYPAVVYCVTYTAGHQIPGILQLMGILYQFPQQISSDCLHKLKGIPSTTVFIFPVVMFTLLWPLGITLISLAMCGISAILRWGDFYHLLVVNGPPTDCGLTSLGRTGCASL